MKCLEVIKLLEELAPLQYAENWDNPGLLAGREEKEVHKIMVALDASENVVSQAVEQYADMLITHHPMIFKPVKKVSTQNFIGKKLVKLIQHDISYYAMHTNFDCAVMASEAGKRLELKNMCVLESINPSIPNVGLGCFGYLNPPLSAKNLAERVKQVFHIPYVTYTGEPKDNITCVAVCPGSGKSMIEYAITCHADVFITGDIDHHTAYDAKEQGLCLMDAGHFGTEHFMAEFVKNYLEKKIAQTEFCIVTAEEQPIFKIL